MGERVEPSALVVDHDHEVQHRLERCVAVLRRMVDGGWFGAHEDTVGMEVEFDLRCDGAGKVVRTLPGSGLVARRRLMHGRAAEALEGRPPGGYSAAGQSLKTSWWHGLPGHGPLSGRPAPIT
jgi:hypothetical protein